MDPVTDPVDVAVVGGGVAGLYVAWSLRTRRAAVPGAAGAPSVVVLESDGRTGGRLHTVRPPGAPHLRAEIGGMRYLDSQRLVVALIAALGLAHRDFTMLDDHDLHLLRGSRFTVADLRAGAAVPYDLAPAERGHTPQELMGTVVRALVPDIATIDAAARRARERDLVFGGRPVRDVAMVEVARQVLSPEGFEYVMDGLGYTVGRDPEVGAVNVLHTDYSVGRPRTLTDGMQALPDALAAAAAEAGAEIRRGVRALAVDHGPDGLLRVATDGADPVVARHVVLALPRAALAALDLSTGPLAGSTLAADLDAVLAVPAAKLYLGFPEPWWERLGIMTGKSVTDLPMRQCLYFGVEDEAAGGEAGNRSALLAATYTDDRATGYWQALRDAGGPAWPAADPALPAPTGMVADARRQLAELHGVDVPEPGWAAFRDWTEPPFGGGWHYWRTGHLSVDVMPRVRRPAPGVNVAVCGEAFSAHQGWILGALSSAERVLQDQLAQPPPAWAPPGAEVDP